MLGRQFAGYGLGWFLSDYNGDKVLNHGGGLSGVISLQTLIPKKNLGVMVLTNFADNSLTTALTYRILDKLLGLPERDWSVEFLKRQKKGAERRKKREQELQAKRAKGTKPSLKLEESTGRYFDRLSGYTEIKNENWQTRF